MRVTGEVLAGSPVPSCPLSSARIRGWRVVSSLLAATQPPLGQVTRSSSHIFRPPDIYPDIYIKALDIKKTIFITL